MPTFEPLFKTIADSIRPTGTILGVVDNNDKTYTFTVDSVGVLMLNNKSITIYDTDGFNSDAEIISDINYVANTFTIRKTAGQAITTLGTFLSLAPFNRVDSQVGYSEFITKTKNGERKNYEDFPSVFLQNGYEETEQFKFKSIYKNINNLKIAFINYTKIDSDNPTRSINEMPYLRELVSQFCEALQKNSRIQEISNIIIVEDPFSPLNQNEAVNVIDLTCDVSYIAKTCNQ